MIAKSMSLTLSTTRITLICSTSLGVSMSLFGLCLLSITPLQSVWVKMFKLENLLSARVILSILTYLACRVILASGKSPRNSYLSASTLTVRGPWPRPANAETPTLSHLSLEDSASASAKLSLKSSRSWPCQLCSAATSSRFWMVSTENPLQRCFITIWSWVDLLLSKSRWHEESNDQSL